MTQPLPRPLRWARDIAIIAALVWIIAFGALWTMQDRLLFPAPSLSRERLDEVAATSGAQVQEIRAADGVRLYGWVFDPPGGRDPRCAVVFFHGNGGALVGIGSWASQITDAGCTLVAFAWRGYPGSDGTPSEVGLRADAQAIVDHVTSPQGLGFEISRVVLFGLSMGTGLAVDQASKRPVAGLVLDSPFTSLADAAASHYPWLPVRTFIRHPLHSLDRTDKVRCPVLVSHGDADRTVPVEQGRAMAKALKATYVEVAGGEHNGFHTLTDAGARGHLLTMLATVRDAPTAPAPPPPR